MRRIAMVIDLKPEKAAHYRALHAAPWPGVVAALRAANVRNYSIFQKDFTLFGYLEYHGTDWAADMAQVAADPETQRWWQETDPCQLRWASAGDGEWWAHMEEIFHID